jgi:histidinol-phosphate phosphatase family protein
VNRAWPPRGKLRAVLCDRDGTLIVDHPYSGDPSLVQPMPGVVEGLRRLRSRGVALGLVTNQSAVGRGLITMDDVRAVNDRVAELVGAFDSVAVCTHRPSDRCRCRKPAPGMIRATARALRIPVRQCVVVGNSGVDIAAARRAGAAAILVSAGEFWSPESPTCEPWKAAPPSEDPGGCAVSNFAEAAARILHYVDL